MACIERIKIEGEDVIPAQVEGLVDVFAANNFVFSKARWVEDNEVSTCKICSNKFNQLRRKHHCRQCGRVLCSKCCSQKVPLPQLGLPDPERVCEVCKPVTECITKSRSSHQSFQLEAVQGLTELVMDSAGMKKVIELGGLQTLVFLSKQENEQIRKHVMCGLHTLASHEPLLGYLVKAGGIKATCRILSCAKEEEEQTVIAGISTLMIFCKSVDFKSQALQDGALQPILALCNMNETIALLAVSTLSLIVQDPRTHAAVIENNNKALPRIIAFTNARDEQMQEVSLNVLAHLSTGTEWHKNRLVQEDFTCGRCLLKVLKTNTRNMQIVFNAACTVANLASSEQSQSALQEHMEIMCNLLSTYDEHTDLLLHISRAVANFSKFPQNASRLVQHLPNVIAISLKSETDAIKFQGMRCLFNLLSHMARPTIEALMKDGASELLEGISDIPGVHDAIQTAILKNIPEVTSPPI